MIPPRPAVLQPNFIFGAENKIQWAVRPDWFQLFQFSLQSQKNKNLRPQTPSDYGRNPFSYLGIDCIRRGAVSFLRLAMLGATGWIAVRLASAPGEDPISRRLASAGKYWLSDLEARAAYAAKQATAGASSLALFEHI